MKTLILTTNFEGQDYHVLLPDESNGVAFGWLVVNEVQKSVVNLENIARKGIYGNLYAERVDLRDLPAEKIQEVIENSNFQVFAPFLKEIEQELVEYMQELREDEADEVYEIEDDQMKLYSAFGIDANVEFKSKAVYDAYAKIVNEYMQNVKTTKIAVLASEAEQIKVLMLQNGFTVL